jgi:hypothetical protein
MITDDFYQLQEENQALREENRVLREEQATVLANRRSSGEHRVCGPPEQFGRWSHIVAIARNYLVLALNLFHRDNFPDISLRFLSPSRSIFRSSDRSA